MGCSLMSVWRQERGLKTEDYDDIFLEYRGKLKPLGYYHKIKGSSGVLYPSTEQMN